MKAEKLGKKDEIKTAVLFECNFFRQSDAKPSSQICIRACEPNEINTTFGTPVKYTFVVEEMRFMKYLINNFCSEM